MVDMFPKELIEWADAVFHYFKPRLCICNSAINFRLASNDSSILQQSIHLHFEPGENDYYKNGKHDDTHLSYSGAKLIASLALQEIARQDLALENYIKLEVLKADIVTLKD